MTTSRLLIAVTAVVLGLATVFLLPRKPGVGEAGIRLQLPDRVGDWEGSDLEVSAREREVLAKDTEFARKIYRNSFGDEILVSIVLSGQDMTNSIHRPERCLPAQGWNVVSSSRVRVPIGARQTLEATKLANAGEFLLKPNGGTDQDPRRVTLHSLNYYWFVGSRDITADHLQRTLWDIRDRILYGQNQRWAYVTVAATITEGMTRFGRSETATAKMMEEFIPKLVPSFQLVNRPNPGS
jgi:EpsI family protein